MHKHHHAMSAGQAFTKFGVITHHGTGEVLFWLVIAVLVIVGFACRSRRHVASK